MSFARLVVHITESNNYFCAKVGDVPEPKAQELNETDGKDKLVAALKSSFDFCNTAMPKITDAALGETPRSIWPLKMLGTLLNRLSRIA